MKSLELFIPVGSGLIIAIASGALVAVFLWVRAPVDRYAKKYRHHLAERRHILLSQQFKLALRASLSSFLCFLFVMALAVVLSFFEDFLRATHRPAPMLVVVQYATWMALVADMVILAKLIWDAVILAGSKPHEPQGRE